MNAIARSSKNPVRVHAVVAGRPVCGGGFMARSANWQWDLADANCPRCAAILKRRADKAALAAATAKSQPALL